MQSLANSLIAIVSYNSYNYVAIAAIIHIAIQV